MAERTVYYATNRRHTGNAERPTGYSGKPSEDGIENLRLGEVRFRVAEDQVTKRLWKASSLGPGDGNSLAKYFSGRIKDNGRVVPYPEKLVSGEGELLPAANQKLGSRRLFEALRAAMTSGCDVLIYVHGYGVSWRSAVASAAALQEMLNRKLGVGDKPVLVLLFSWPSDGKKIPWTSYRSDRKDAADSGLALGRGILKLRDYLSGLSPRDYCGQNLHVLCHSMGNWVLRNAIDRILEYGGPRPLPRVLDSVFMCSPDVADSVFDNLGNSPGPMLPLLELARSVSIYHNRGDAALVVSDTTKGNENRLGSNGAAHPQSLHSRIQQVDCSEQVHGVVEHSYYMVGRVNEDIRQTVDDQQPNFELRNRRRGPWENTWVLT